MQYFVAIPLALRPNPTSFFALIQKTEAKKIKATFKIPC